jgi:acyl carrier protein
MAAIMASAGSDMGASNAATKGNRRNQRLDLGQARQILHQVRYAGAKKCQIANRVATIRPLMKNTVCLAAPPLRLRQDFRAAVALIKRNRKGLFATKQPPQAKPTSIELRAPLRYTGTRLRPGDRAFRGDAPSAASHPGIYRQYIKGLMMSSTYDQIANIIAETCDIPRDTIKPESHAIDDLGIDSLDFLDIAFAIDKAFGIKMPLEKWTQEVNDGKATTEQYFVLKNLADRIDELVAAKNAGAGTGP